MLCQHFWCETICLGFRICPGLPKHVPPVAHEDSNWCQCRKQSTAMYLRGDLSIFFQLWHKSTAGHFDTSQPFRLYFLSSAHYLSLHSDALSTDAFLISSALKHTVSEILPYVNTYVSVSISIWCRAVFIFFFPGNRNYGVYTTTFRLYLNIVVSLNKLIKYD